MNALFNLPQTEDELWLGR